MNKPVLSLVSGASGLSSVFLIALYFITGLDRSVMLSPLQRLLLLVPACLLLWLSGKLAAVLLPEKRKPIMKTVFSVAFVLYIVLLLTFTLFDSWFGRGGFSFIFLTDAVSRGIYTSESVNLIPFRTLICFISGLADGSLGVGFVVINILGNLTAFMPMALFLPVLFDTCRRFKVFTACTSASVIFIELAQIVFLTGFCDIDDFILNTGGAMLAWAVLHIPVVRTAFSRLLCIEY